MDVSASPMSSPTPAMRNPRYSLISTSTTLLAYSEDEDDEYDKREKVYSINDNAHMKDRHVHLHNTRSRSNSQQLTEPTLEKQIQDIDAIIKGIDLRRRQASLAHREPSNSSLKGKEPTLERIVSSGSQRRSLYKACDERDSKYDDSGVDVGDIDDTRIKFLIEDSEDQLDRLISISSQMLRVSRSVLDSTKRLSVIEAAGAQRACTQEDEIRRHLESLETQERFMSLMSSDAHQILHPTPGAAPRNPLYRPPARLRTRASISDTSALAKTAYVHARSTTGASASDIGDGGEHDEIVGDAASPTLSHDFSNPGRSAVSHLQKSAPSSTLSSNTPPLSSSVPSTFLSSLWSKASSSSSIPSESSIAVCPSVHPTPANVTDPVKRDAKSLLSILADKSPQPGATRSDVPTHQAVDKPVSQMSNTTHILPQALRKNHLRSRHSISPVTSYDILQQKTSSVPPEAIIAKDMATSPHLTISRAAGGLEHDLDLEGQQDKLSPLPSLSSGRPKHRVSLSESLLRNSILAWGGASTKASEELCKRTDGPRPAADMEIDRAENFSDTSVTKQERSGAHKHKTPPTVQLAGFPSSRPYFPESFRRTRELSAPI